MPEMGKTEEDWNGFKLGFLKTVQPNSCLQPTACNFKNRLQNRWFFFSKSVKKSVKSGVRALCTRSVRVSHALCFQPRSRPVVWLLAHTGIRKNTDCFAIYFKNNAQETYLFVSDLWFCHLHVISLLTLSSIAIEGKELAKLNKMNWTAVTQPL